MNSSITNTDAFLQDAFLRMDLIKVRKSKGLSQKDIAEKSGLSISTISNIENIKEQRSYTIRSLVLYADSLGYEITMRKKE